MPKHGVWKGDDGWEKKAARCRVLFPNSYQTKFKNFFLLNEMQLIIWHFKNITAPIVCLDNPNNRGLKMPLKK